jgi:hypothetical protein
MVVSARGAFEVLETVFRGHTRSVHRARRAGATGARTVRLVVERSSLPRERLEAAFRLSIPGVARLLAWGDEPGGGVWYETELPEGSTLESRVAGEGPLPLAEALATFDLLLDRLGQAHERGVVHGSLDARRVVLAACGPWLLDHGTGDGTWDEFPTILARAPELRTGRAPDVRSDLYGVGVLLRYALSAEYPFAEAACRSGPVDAPPPLDVARPVAAFVMRLLSTDPQDRFESALEARRALAEAQGRVESPRAGAGSARLVSTEKKARAAEARALAAEASLQEALREVEIERAKVRDEAARTRAVERSLDEALRENERLRDAARALERRAAKSEKSLENAQLNAGELFASLRDAEALNVSSEQARAEAVAAAERARSELEEGRARAANAEREKEAALSALEAARTAHRELEDRLVRSVKALSEAVILAESHRNARRALEARVRAAGIVDLEALAPGAAKRPEPARDGSSTATPA